MRSQKRFDHDEFVRGFRAACTRRGIDPLEGATLYDVVRVLAEQAEARRTRDRWWKRHKLWRACQPNHSELEEEVIWELFLQSYLPHMKRLARWVALRNARLTLRDIYEQIEEREVGE